MSLARNERPPLRVLVADEDALVRKGVRCMLGHVRKDAVVHEAGSARELAGRLEREQPDIVVLDAELGASPTETVGLVRRRSPHAHAIVVGPVGDLAPVRQAFAAGAHGYVAKDQAVEELPVAIDQVARGGRYLDPRLGAGLALAEVDRHSNGPLTADEQRVLALVADGLTNREIAVRLGRPARTVEGIRLRGQRKLGVSSRAQLVAYEHARGLDGAGR